MPAIAELVAALSYRQRHDLKRLAAHAWYSTPAGFRRDGSQETIGRSRAARFYAQGLLLLERRGTRLVVVFTRKGNDALAALGEKAPKVQPVAPPGEAAPARYWWLDR